MSDVNDPIGIVLPCLYQWGCFAFRMHESELAIPDFGLWHPVRHIVSDLHVVILRLRVFHPANPINPTKEQVGQANHGSGK